MSAEDITRPALMQALRAADADGNHILWNAAVECLSRRFWIRTDDYVLRTADGPIDPEVSRSILRRHRRRLQHWPPST